MAYSLDPRLIFLRGGAVGSQEDYFVVRMKIVQILTTKFTGESFNDFQLLKRPEE